MSKSVFVDTDVILDLLLDRKPFFDHSVTVFSLIETGKLKGYVSALVIWNIYYLLEKYASRKQAREKVAKLRLLLSIIPVDEKLIDLALQSDFKDFEDSIQYYAAKSKGLRTFLTRNTKDYRTADIAVMTPAESLQTL